MKVLNVAGLGVAVWLLAVSIAGADVHVTMQNGRVSVVAKDVTVRQILTEWARVGQTKLVNIERITGGPVTIEVTDVPEQQALETLLRSASGYMLAPRAVPAPNLAQFDRIIVMPASVAPRAAAPPAAVFQPPQQRQPVSENDNEPQGPGAPALAPPSGPVFNAFPQPQFGGPDQQNGPPDVPGALPFQGAPPFQAGPPGASPVPAQQPATTPGAARPTSSTTPSSPFGGTARPGEVAPPPTPTVTPQSPGSSPR